MFVLANFLMAVAQILDMVLNFGIILILIRALISWVNPDPYNPIVQVLYRSTEPLLRPFRRLLPPWRTGGIDFSPFVATLLLVFVKILVVQTILDYAATLRHPLMTL
jgi:YggT family protein